MNNEKINIDNYEAFYLDFLEGNLSNEDKLAFSSFLKVHPDLVEEDVEFLSLMSSDKKLDQKIKNNLLVFDSSAMISTSNLENFLVAKKEGLLTLSQLNDLKLFLLAHPQFESDSKYMQATSLLPNEKIVFKSKSRLKQKEKIVLWPYLSALTAACVVALIYLNFPSGFDDTNILSASQRVPNNNATPKIENGSEVPNQSLLARNDHFVPAAVKRTQTKETENPFVITAQLTEKTVLPILGSVSSDNIKILNQFPKSTVTTQEANEITVDYASAAVEMKNAIVPFTHRVSELINREFSIQKGQSNDNKRKAFGFKIGSFEFYRTFRNKENSN
jgi:hypothetical protein